VRFTRHFAHWPPGIPHTLEVPRESVYANLAKKAAEHPERIAVDYYGTRVSYTELKRDADALAGYLQRRRGVAKGDRVLLYLQNSPQFIIAYYAVLRADAVVVPVNPMNRTEELRHYVEDAQASVAIVGQELYERIAPLAVADGVVATYADFLRTPTDLPIPDFVRAPRIATGGTAWRDAIDARLAPGEQRAAADDLAVMPPCRISTGAARPRTRSCSLRCRCSTSPACRPG
jgi:fatty-acyl-CoA synthase